MEQPILFFPRNPHNGVIDTEIVAFYQDKNNPNLFIKLQTNFLLPKYYIYSTELNNLISALYYKPADNINQEGYLYEQLNLNYENVNYNRVHNVVQDNSSDTESISRFSPSENNSEEIIDTYNIGIQCDIIRYDNNFLQRKYFNMWKLISEKNNFLKRKNYLQPKFFKIWKINTDVIIRRREKRINKKQKKTNQKKCKLEIVLYWQKLTQNNFKIKNKYFNLWKTNSSKNKLWKIQTVELWKTNTQLNKLLKIKYFNLWKINSSKNKLLKIKYFEKWYCTYLYNKNLKKSNKKKSNKKKSKKKKSKSNIVPFTENKDFFNPYENPLNYYFNMINKKTYQEKIPSKYNFNTKLLIKIIFYAKFETYLNILKTNSHLNKLAKIEELKVPNAMKICIDELSFRNLIPYVIHNIDYSLEVLNHYLKKNNSTNVLVQQNSDIFDQHFINMIIEQSINNLYTNDKLNKLKYIFKNKHIPFVKNIILKDTTINKNVYFICTNINNQFEIIQFFHIEKRFTTFIIDPMSFIEGLNIYIKKYINNIKFINNTKLFSNNHNKPMINNIYTFIDMDSIKKIYDIHIILSSISENRILSKFLKRNDIYSFHNKQASIVESRLLLFKEIFKGWVERLHYFPIIFNDWFKFLKFKFGNCYLCGEKINKNEANICKTHKYHESCYNNFIKKNNYKIHSCPSCNLNQHPHYKSFVYINKFYNYPIIYTIVKNEQNIFSPLIITLNESNSKDLVKRCKENFAELASKFSQKFISEFKSEFNSIDKRSIVDIYLHENVEVIIKGTLSECLKQKYRIDDIKKSLNIYKKYNKSFNYNLVILEQYESSTIQPKLYITNTSELVLYKKDYHLI